MTPRYDARISQGQVALTAEELDLLLASDLRQMSDPTHVRHLLGRVRAAYAGQLEQLRTLQRDVERLHASSRTHKDPVATALEALARMTLEQQSIVYDVREQALLDAVRVARDEAQAALTAARSESSRARFALERAMSDPSLPAAARERLAEVLPLLPAATPALDEGLDSAAPPEVGRPTAPSGRSAVAASDQVSGPSKLSDLFGDESGPES